MKSQAEMRDQAGSETQGLRGQVVTLAQTVVKLRESERLYREAIEVAGAVPYYLDYAKGEYTFMGSGIKALTGFSPEEFTPAVWNSMMQETVLFDELPDLALEDPSKRGAGRPDIPWRGECRIINRDGEEKWLDNASVHVIDSQGTIVGALGILSDITARKHAFEELRKSEERYAAACRAGKAGVWSYRPIDKHFFCDANLRALLGLRENELGIDVAEWFPMVHPDYRAWMEEVVESGLKGFAQTVKAEHRVLHKDGTVRWFLSSGSIFFDSNGVADRVIGVSTDITSHVEIAGALRESEQRFRALVENTPMGFWQETAAGQTVYVNPAMRRLLGVQNQEELHGLNWRSFLTAESRAAIDTQPGGRPDSHARNYEVEILGKDAQKRNLVVYEVPLRSADGTPQGMISSFHDVTERRRAETQRRELEMQVQYAQKLESLGVLAGGIAHDFNNILMTILGNADLALQDLSSVSPARPFVEEIVKASRRAADLTNQMLAYSGRGRFVIMHVDVSEIVAEMARLLAASVAKNVTLKTDLGKQLPLIQADTAQIQQIVMNLIINASESIRKDDVGLVVLSTGAADYTADELRHGFLPEPPAPGRYVYVEVCDNGCGIDEETRKKMFDPFFTTKFAGRGLGLAAVLGIVRGHKGAVTVNSIPGEGTTFRVLFPALDVCAEARAEEELPEPGDIPVCATVLMVDDEDSIISLGRQMLERLGYTVLTASDGVEAIQVFREYGDEIDCVLLDLSMPQMGGEEAFHELRHIKKDTPIILSSGYHEQEISQRFAGLDMNGFIQKPYQLDRLKKELRRVLEEEARRRCAL